MPFQVHPVVILALALLVIFLFAALLFGRFARLWIQSLMAGAPIALVQLVAMRFRRVDPQLIVENRIKGVQAGLGPDQGFTTHALESHYLAGGNVPAVVDALIAAQREGLPMRFDELAALDLAGHDVQKAVEGRMLTGAQAIAETEIPIAGTISLEGRRLRAVSLSGQIAAGAPVQVVSISDDIALVETPSTR